MTILPTEALPLLVEISPVFTQPTFGRFVTLMASGILTTGRRTIANLLRTASSLAVGHRTSYQRVWSHAHWSALQLACALTRFVLAQLVPRGTVTLVGDDTVDGHKGKKVFGKARHRDPVRSSQSYTTWRYGHKWVVLCILVRFPFATRPWALPVLVSLYLSRDDKRRRNRPHRTPAQLMCCMLRILFKITTLNSPSGAGGQFMCCMLRILLGWFPQRRFVFIGDSAYGTHEVARFAHRHRPRLTLVSKLHPDANLYARPSARRGPGRPRVKGRRLAKPRSAATRQPRRRLKVGWYGGGQRHVEVATGTGNWYKAGHGLVPLRWVFVHDRQGTHRDEYFYTTDPKLTPKAIISYYTARWNIDSTFQELRIGCIACRRAFWPSWNIETTFQELRSHLGLETTRGWCANTILRAAPCLFGLYTIVAVLFQQLPESKRTGTVAWPGKVGVTFSDALAAVRRWLWTEWVFPQLPGGFTIEKLPRPIRDTLFIMLASAA